NNNLFITSVVSVNLGIWFVVVGSYISPFLVFLGRLMEIIAGFFFLLHAWGRIKPTGQ
ncbi:MAG: DUF1145 domain-containing protein, partial [Chloroflexi bacterium]